MYIIYRCVCLLHYSHYIILITNINIINLCLYVFEYGVFTHVYIGPMFQTYTKHFDVSTGQAFCPASGWRSKSRKHRIRRSWQWEWVGWGIARLLSLNAMGNIGKSWHIMTHVKKSWEQLGYQYHEKPVIDVVGITFFTRSPWNGETLDDTLIPGSLGHRTAPRSPGSSNSGGRFSSKLCLIGRG